MGILRDMHRDGREIESLWDANGSEIVNLSSPHFDYCDKIEWSEEPGQGAMVTWFTLCKGSHVVSVVNAAHVSQVVYRDPYG